MSWNSDWETEDTNSSEECIEAFNTRDALERCYRPAGSEARLQIVERWGLVYMRPVSAKITTISNTRPNPPLG